MCHKKYIMKELSSLDLELHRESTCPAESSIELLFIMGNIGAFPLFLGIHFPALGSYLTLALNFCFQMLLLQ